MDRATDAMTAQPTQRAPERNRGGRWVTFGDEMLRVPPLGFRDVIELQADVESLRSLESGGHPTPEQMRVVTKIVHAAIRRNYPGMQLDEVADMIDLSNFMAVLNATLDVGGFSRRPSSEASGEVAASTGTGSTAP